MRGIPPLISEHDLSYSRPAYETVTRGIPKSSGDVIAVPAEVMNEFFFGGGAIAQPRELGQQEASGEGAPVSALAAEVCDETTGG